MPQTLAHFLKHLHFLRHKNTWSMRSQLMIFLCAICLIVLLCAWGISDLLIRPYYNRMMHHHLEEQLTSIVQLMDDMSEQDISISSRTNGAIVIDTTFRTAFYQAVADADIQLADLCINISDTSLSYVMYSENVYPCLLHGESSSIFTDEEIAHARDTDETIAWRKTCFETGFVSTTIHEGELEQMLLGKTTADAQYAVFVSASLSQILDPVILFQALAPAVSVIVIVISFLVALLFSWWFTKPISTLTKASHALAQGDYSVSLPVTRRGELGQLTTEFNQMARAVHRSDQLQRELLANVSHDLRTPLTLIRGYAETIRDITGDKPQKRAEQLDVIIDETNHLTKLVNSILELSKYTTGAQHLHPVTLNLCTFCQGIVQRYEGICAQNQWTLLLDMPKGAPIFIYADPTALERAIDNLLGNAMHHLGDDGVFILRLSIRPRGNCCIAVEDHGNGIPPEELENVFLRHYRCRADAGKPGAGLGLPIARAIFNQHKFRFGVESEPGRTVFWFSAKMIHPKN